MIPVRRREEGFFSIISIVMTLVIMGFMAAIVVKAMGDADDKAGTPSPIDILDGTDTTSAPVQPQPAPTGSPAGAAGLAGAGVAGGVVAGAAGMAATGGGGASAPQGIRGTAATAACQADYQSVAQAVALSQASGGPPATSTADLVARGFLSVAPANPAYSIEVRPGDDGVTPTVYANGQATIAGCG